MKLLRMAELLARVGVPVLGVALGAAALGLSPAGCHRGTGQELVAEGGRPALLRVAALGPAWETGRVVRVIDGDTYEVLTGGQVLRVRLLGVDAPETGQPFGHQASDSVRACAGGQLVRLQRQGIDLYGRTLGHVRMLPQGRTLWPVLPSVALDSVLVVRGWAWAFDPAHTVAGRAQQQTQAQAAGRGLWKCGTDEPVPPKLWRSFNAEIKRRYLGGCSW